jgi:hypothetical protein
MKRIAVLAATLAPRVRPFLKQMCINPFLTTLFRATSIALPLLLLEGCAQSNDIGESLVPPQFRGEWNADIDSCKTGTESSLSIGADSIWFYESQGPLRDIRRRGDLEFTAIAHLSGEGEVWTEPIHFRLSPDGKKLTDLDPEVRGFSRWRCP